MGERSCDKALFDRPYGNIHADFAGMMEKGLLRAEDPAMLAFAYTAPITVLIHLCDREPEKTPEAMTQIEAFCRHLIRTYGKE